jgi:hypothetical protein
VNAAANFDMLMWISIMSSIGKYLRMNGISRKRVWVLLAIVSGRSIIKMFRLAPHPRAIPTQTPLLELYSMKAIANRNIRPENSTNDQNK